MLQRIQVGKNSTLKKQTKELESELDVTSIILAREEAKVKVCLENLHALKLSQCSVCIVTFLLFVVVLSFSENVFLGSLSGSSLLANIYI